MKREFLRNFAIDFSEVRGSQSASSQDTVYLLSERVREEAGPDNLMKMDGRSRDEATSNRFEEDPSG